MLIRLLRLHAAKREFCHWRLSVRRSTEHSWLTWLRHIICTRLSFEDIFLRSIPYYLLIFRLTTRNFTMHTHILNALALASLAIAHGDHQQVPMAGPHKQLWYNTLPGDGGKQVSFQLKIGHSVKGLVWHKNPLPGGLSLLGYFDIRTAAVFSLFGQWWRGIRYCFLRCVCFFAYKFASSIKNTLKS